MGNRVYVTLKSREETKLFYMHWNGCMLTWAPLVKAIFEHNVKSVQTVIDFLNKEDLSPEEVEYNSKTARWVEENGAYIVDLDSQKFERFNRTKNGSESRSFVTDFKEAFENRLKSYLPEAWDRKRESNWEGLQKDFAEFVKGKTA